jgi:HEPN domain-containing protein
MNDSIKTEEEFLELIERINTKHRDTSLQSRYLILLLEIVKLYPKNAEIPIFYEYKVIPGNYTGTSLYAHIKKWCDDQYGENQKVSADIGSVIFKIHDQKWQLRVILILVMRKPFRLVYKDIDATDWSEDDISILNMRRMFINLPPGLAKKIKDEDLENEKKILSMAICAINFFKKIENFKFVKEALVDFMAVRSELIKNNGSFGQSRWSTLQFIEKLIKAYLSFKKAKVKQTHNLTSLADDARDNDMRLLNSDDIKLVNCNAGVRYGEIPCTEQEALESHHASIRIAYEISLSFISEINKQKQKK